MIILELILTLCEVLDCLCHNNICLKSRLVRNQDPEELAEEVLEHSSFRNIMLVPLGWRSADNAPENGIDTRGAARLLSGPVMALPCRIRVFT